MLMEQNETLTQIERMTQILSEMRHNVTIGDRKEANATLNIPPSTINRYLSGKGNDCDIAGKLIPFFRKRIADREAIINP